MIITFVLYALFLIYTYKSKAWVFLIVLFISLSRLLIITYPIPNDYIARVIDVRENYVIAKVARSKVIIYSDNDLNYDSIITYTGEYKEILTPKSKYSFQFDKYMLRNNVKYSIKAKNINVVNQKNSLRSRLYNKIKTHPDAKILNKLFLRINSQDLDLDILGLIASAGVIIKSLIYTIKNILAKFLYKERVFICELILYFIFMLIFKNYLFYLNIIFYTLLLKLKFNKPDSVLLSSTLVLLINPLYMFSLSFIINFLFRLVRVVALNKNIKSVTAILILVPVQLRLFYSTSLVQIVLYRYYKLLGVAAYLLGIIDIIFKTSLARGLLELFDFKINILTFTGYMPNIILFVWIFFSLLVLSRKNIYYKLSLICLIIINQNQLLLYPSLVYTQLYIGQGDCAIMRYPHKREVLFIDTGPPNAQRNVKAYLDYYGVKNIHSIIITHDDLDHSGNKDFLIENFNVKSLVENAKTTNFYNLQLESINFEMEDLNENSLITYFTINGWTYLTLGDASKLVELMFLKDYPNIKPNIIKLGHHGSNTSSDEQLLELDSISLLLNSSGYNNMYKHPNYLVLQRILKYQIPFIDTQQVGDIEIIHLFGYDFLTY